jgi:hypothetical protein
MTFLPFPNDSTKYYLFHQRRDQDSVLSYPTRKLMFSVINSKLDDGTGGVISRNQIIAEDHFSLGGIKACKHGNGRDWWIIAPKAGRQAYHAVKVTPNGVEKSIFQKLNDDEFDIYDGSGGLNVFSPDGSIFVRSTNSDPGTFIMKFDRCTGKMSDIVNIKYKWEACSGVAISPNSRYLYVTARRWLYQYDLQADDIQKSQVLIDTFDGYKSWFGVSTNFCKIALAPNGKIYISSLSSTESMHVINNPDEAGKACNFVQRGFPLKALLYSALPNFPNYNLGAKKGSPCENDLSTSTEIYVPNKIHIFPNPAQDYLNISLREYYEKLVIYDVNGKELQKITTNREESHYKIDISHFLSGIYFISGISPNGKKIGAQRFVVQ